MNTRTKKELKTLKYPSMLQITNVTELPEAEKPIKAIELQRGDCFLRCGSLCMVVECKEVATPKMAHNSPETVAIINLGTGRVWAIPATEEVEPVVEVKLTFKEQL